MVVKVYALISEDLFNKILIKNIFKDINLQSMFNKNCYVKLLLIAMKKFRISVNFNKIQRKTQYSYNFH